MKKLLEINIFLVFLFLYIPILVIVAFSFNSGDQISVWEGFSLGWYSKLFKNPDVWRACKNSLIIACVSTFISTVIGTAAALAIEKYRFRIRNTLIRSLYLPLIIPDIVFSDCVVDILCASQISTRINVSNFCACSFQYSLCYNCSPRAFTRV